VARGYARIRYVGAAASPQQQQLSPTLLARLERAAEALGVTFNIFSGYRTDAYSASHGGFAGDPHTRHIAADVNVGNQPLGDYLSSIGRNAATFLARFKLRSGDQPGFYHGRPDPAHVDLVAGSSGASGGAFSYPELQRLWTQAGGSPALAPIMAAIALAETHGNPNAHHVTRREDSRGLWQINVRAHPQFAHANLYDPNVNAQAAVAVYRSQGLGAWSTYTSGAYQSYLGDSSTTSSRRYGGTRPGGGDGNELADFHLGELLWGDPFKTFGGPGLQDPTKSVIGDITDSAKAAMTAVKFMVWLLSPHNLLRAVEFLVGVGLIALGLVAVLLNFFSREELPAGTGPAARATSSLRRGARRTAPVRAIRGRRARRQGEAQQRETEESDRLRRERERGRKRQRARSTNRRLRREGRRTQSDDIPF
jgi:Lysozyme like domain